MRRPCRFGAAALAGLVVLVVAGAKAAQAEERAIVVNAAGRSSTQATTRTDTRAALAPQVVALRSRLVAEGHASLPPEPVRALVEGTAERFVPDFAAVRQRFADFDHAECRKLLDKLLDNTLARADTAELAGQVAEVLFWLGRVAVAQNDITAARRWFRGAHHLVPSFAVDPAQYPPQVQKTYEQATRATAQQRGVMAVKVLPIDAWLWIDGVGRSEPSTGEVELPAGLHLVVLGHPGFARHAQLVEVPARGRVVVDVRLEAALAEQVVTEALEQLAPSAPEHPDLEAARRLARALGVTRLLVVEGEDAGALLVRLYDLKRAVISAPARIGANTDVPAALAAALASPRMAARPASNDTLADTPALDLATTGPAHPAARHDSPWYRRWWVWAIAAGAVTTAGSVYLISRDAGVEIVCCSEP